MNYPHEITGNEQALKHGQLWNRVCKTDPESTKKVSRGARKFTAIAAYSQIKAATKLWGPVGQGWGWEIKNIQFWGDPSDANLCVVHITFWYSYEDVNPNENNPFRRQEFDSVGVNVAARKVRDKGYISVDDDCAKKALTDAITKALSYLGFNADVFFGGFDDNKYVAALQAETGHSAQPEDRGTPAGQRTGADTQRDTAPAKRDDGMPGWFDDNVGGGGKWKDKTWEWLTKGGVDGGRHQYLRWYYQHLKSGKILKRASWILEKFYEDLEAKEGKLKSGAELADEAEGAGYSGPPDE